ncbi:protein phosphatase 1 regulatory subunit 36 [Entelurus aequoreus]|uniref:protein phosphatase 1 regulatory subunit 36 n=1 Tax=Entelurus aequoreus TaxID=161455 RepID=UPI002B1D552F|nr:protein phosphatase 1 regulatory subunit 36 [Entelurus aequoreus]XP_061884895.1 protein phosphatase 1 regulatory subunit 36 [Entelurus aequoreus]
MTTVPSSGWMWNDDSNTLEFKGPAAEKDEVLEKGKPTRDHMKDLQKRSEWLADVCILTTRGRQSSRKSLSTARLNAYRASVLQKQSDHVTIDDVKQVAVALLQENYSLPIPLCFMALLKRKELDDVLTALLLYVSYYIEHGKAAQPSLFLETNTDHQKVAEIQAKKEIAQKILAVHYFSLTMDLVVAQGMQHSHAAFQKGQMGVSKNEWLLHACLYSFFCCVAWVAFGRKYMSNIQEEVGRLLYSDAFNTAVRNTTEETSSFAYNGSTVMDDSQGKRRSTHGRRMFQRHPALSKIANQRSPLMVCLLPTPKEQSPHLFSGSRARGLSPAQTEHFDNKVLTEEVNQQLASVKFGILGKPLKEFNPSTLLSKEEEEGNNRFV